MVWHQSYQILSTGYRHEAFKKKKCVLENVVTENLTTGRPQNSKILIKNKYPISTQANIQFCIGDKILIILCLSKTSLQVKISAEDDKHTYLGLANIPENLKTNVHI